MGHDITVYKLKETGYLRRNSGSTTVHLLYASLFASRHDGGVSGYGGSETFSITQIEHAITLLKKENKEGCLDHEIEFLTKCLDAFEDTDDGMIAINFS